MPCSTYISVKHSLVLWRHLPAPVAVRPDSSALREPRSALDSAAQQSPRPTTRQVACAQDREHETSQVTSTTADLERYLRDLCTLHTDGGVQIAHITMFTMDATTSRSQPTTLPRLHVTSSPRRKKRRHKHPTRGTCARSRERARGQPRAQNPRCAQPCRSVGTPPPSLGRLHRSHPSRAIHDVEQTRHAALMRAAAHGCGGTARALGGRTADRGRKSARFAAYAASREQARDKARIAEETRSILHD